MKNDRIVLITLSFVLIGAALFMWFGMYNIAADNKHWKVTEWLFGIVRDRSIASKSANITIPSNLDDVAVFVKGAGNYDEMCRSCHLSPGIKSSELSVGLYPRPPDFTQYPLNNPARSFWVIKHGIKMTGMPAWGTSHTDEEIWQLVAFIHQLQKMDHKSYEELVSTYGGSHQHTNGHGHDEGSTDIQMPYSDGHNHEH